MGFYRILTFLLTLSFFVACAQQAPAPTKTERSIATSDNALNYKVGIDIEDYRDQMSFFSLMRYEIKPALDRFAKDGFVVGNSAVMKHALANVDKQVAREGVQSAGSEAKLYSIADKLASKGKITFYNLPGHIASAGAPQGRYALSTFMSLASGGGVMVKIDDKNFTYNVNYGDGSQDKDEMTGRSFGEGPTHKALDASDKYYLKSLEAYVRKDKKNIPTFYRGLLSILTNCDTSRYHEITDEGQSVGADFLAVYIAEQDRHLMADLRAYAWDEALLEVTLLSAFHAGQDEVHVMYQGQLTNRTNPQHSGCKPADPKTRPASMVDYWQFSNSTDPKNCNRSGINITRREFRALGKALTGYIAKKNPALVKRIQSRLDGVRPSGNLFADLSSYLINYKTAKKIQDPDGLVEDFVTFLMEVNKAANPMTQSFVGQRFAAAE